MLRERDKKRKLILWIIIAVTIIILSVLGYMLLTYWLPGTSEEAENSMIFRETEQPSLPTIVQSTPIVTTTIPPPSVETEIPPTNIPIETNTPTPSPTPEPLPSTTTVPTVTYQPATPAPITTVKKAEDYGFNPADVLNFQNTQIKEGILENLKANGFSVQSEITIGDLFNLESLIIVPRHEVFDESELNCCRESLGVLTVIHNDYEWSLEFLKYAKNLKVIYCYNNYVKKVMTLNNLENLLYVGFPECNITSLLFIENLHSLVGINFSFNELTTFTPIANLQNLKSIRLIDNNLYNLNPLTKAAYPEINDLWLWGNNISDISPLAFIPNLKFLALGNNDIEDFSPVLELPELNELYIDVDQAVEFVDIFNELKNRGCNVVIIGQ